MSCATDKEIGEAVGLSPDAVALQVKECRESATLPNIGKVAATFADADWTPPLYNVWTFSRKSNKVGHFGNSEQHKQAHARAGAARHYRFCKCKR